MRIGLAVLLLAAAPALAADPPGMVTKTYPIGDLIVTVPVMPAPVPVMMTECKVYPPYTPPQVGQLAVPVPAIPAVPVAPVVGVRVAPPPMAPVARRNADHLLRLVPAMIKPLSWTDGGGAGTIRFDESASCLVVTQTADTQAHVAELLASLRKLQAKSNQQIMVQMTILDVGPKFFEVAGLKQDCDGSTCKKTVVGLTAEQAQSLTAGIRAAKEANQVDILARPQLMVLDGETGTFLGGGNSQGNPTGIETTITPKLSADGNSILLRVKCAHSTQNKSPVVVQGEKSVTPADVLTAPVVEVQTIETTVALPPGATGLILGPTRTREVFTAGSAQSTPGFNFNVTLGAETRRSVIVLTPQLVAPGAPMPVSTTAPPPVAALPAVPPPPLPRPAASATYQKAMPMSDVTYLTPLTQPAVPRAVQVYPTPPMMAPVAPPVATAPRRTASEVMVNMTIVEVRSDFFEKVGLDFGKAAIAREAKCVSVGLSPEQAQSLGTAIRTGKQEGYLEVLSSPRLMIADGQNGCFQLGQQVALPTVVGQTEKVECVETGILAKVTPKLSADRKSITLHLNYTHSAVNPTPIVVNADAKPSDVITTHAIDSQNFETTVALPNGGTGLILGPVRTCETRVEHRVPVMSDIPYVNRLFKTTGIGHEQRRQVIIVTPHVMTSAKDQAAWLAKESQGMTFTAATPAPVSVAKPVSRTELLVAEYRKACAEGRTEDAMKCAMQALAIDPKCFANEK